MRVAFVFGMAGLVLAAGAAMAQQPRTIVGTWHFPNQGCTFEQGAMRIGPLSLDSEDVHCKFRTVERQGNTVIWRGKCDSAEGGSEQQVIATEAPNGTLSITYRPGGNRLDGLRRCPR